MLFTKLLVLFLMLLLAFPAWSYDFPLSESSIRDAYFLGTREGGLKPDFLAQYSRWIPALKEGTCTSEARLETPFFQVVNYAGKVPNYSAQDAVKEFRDKPLPFHVYLDICYKPNAPLNAIKVKVLQNKKEVVPLTYQSSRYIPRVDEYATLPPNGEQLYLEFKSSQIDSSTLTIVIDTPDDQHASAEFDLHAFR